MYPFFRLMRTLFKAHRAPSIDLMEQTEVSFYCRPWDLDPFLEMNNGRILTLFDLGRFDVAVRTGLWKTLKKQGWGLAVAGSSVRYRKRIKLFDRVVMKTRMSGIEGRWFYIEQSMWVGGQPCVSVLLRTCVTGGGRAVNGDEVFAAMGLEPFSEPLSDWVQAWVDGDSKRPWPPQA